MASSGGMNAPSNVLGLGPEPQSGEPKLYGKGPNASLEQEALDYSNHMKQSQKQIHKKNSLSQGLVIQRKKRLINTLSSTTNPGGGVMPNSQSYQLSGKQIPSK